MERRERKERKGEGREKYRKDVWMKGTSKETKESKGKERTARDERKKR